MKFRIVTILASIAMPAMAHEGHGISSARSLFHYVVEPQHIGNVLLLLLLLAVAVAAYRRIRGVSSSRDERDRR